jgi:hypothetical protein
MRRQIVALALGAGLAGAGALSGACGIGLSGTDSAEDAGNDVVTVDASQADGGSQDAQAVDATQDASPADAAPTPDAALDASTDSRADSAADTGVDAEAGCSGEWCGTTCIPINTCGTQCPGFPVQCNASRTCVADCASCAGLPIDCAYCPQGGVTQVCIPQQTPCMAGAMACPCADGDAGDCPAANQVCLTLGQGPGFCGTCGDPATQGKTCSGGGSCTASTETCQ